MKSIIIGTAGHIDHGKTELIKALTGIDTDRLKEEKERGITIDIGFASLAFGEDLLLGFVDVPGHERFVKNMLAGAAGIDIVLLVVAADESIMPQTLEHFEICKLLGVKSGLVALTKRDLVDEEVLKLVEMEVNDLLRGSFMEQAPIIPVSSRTGEGIESLKEKMHELALNVEEKSEGGIARLPIDRSFSIKGFGTVVTGTLLQGRIAIDEELEILPAGKRCRVRGIEVHGGSREFARAGQRTALNIAGVSALEMERGDTLSAPGVLKPARMVDARMTLLRSAKPLKDFSQVRFHHGTSEIMARVRMLKAGPLAPGDSMYVQLRMGKPVVVLPGDRFIVRLHSPTITIGGGTVLDNDPKKHRVDDEAVLKTLSVLESGNEMEKLKRFLALYGEQGASLQEMERRTGMERRRMEDLLQELVQAGEIVRIQADRVLFLSGRHYGQLIERTKETLLRYHEANPLSPGVGKEELRRKIAKALPPDLFESVLHCLRAEGEIRVDASLVIHKDHRIELSLLEQEIRDYLEGEFQKGRLDPPEMKAVLAVSRFKKETVEKIFHLLLREGRLIKMSDGKVFHRDPIRALLERLKQYAEKKSIIDIATFKELAGITRKNAIPILEYLDSIKVTRRVGNERRIVKENLK